MEKEATVYGRVTAISVFWKAAGISWILNFYPFPNKPWAFTCLLYKSFENTVGKGEIALNEQFLLFPWCFLPF